MKTQRLQGDSTNDMKRAAELLMHGGLVAVPTETVYGLAANAADENAVKKIFEAKGRPANHPLIVHVPNSEQLSQWAVDIPDEAYQLAEKFWPGPLTFLLKKHDHVNDVITGGLDTIGIRNPAHPVLLSLLKKTGLGVAAPSANPYKKLSPTTADQVFETLNGKIDAVLDGGPCDVGIESTILDLTSNQPTVLRPGPITARQIADVLGKPVDTPNEHNVSVPGNVEAHYQPGKPLHLMTTAQIRSQNHKSHDVACVYYSEELAEFMQLKDVRLPNDKAGYAQAIYHTLYQLDHSEINAIWLELPPDTDDWRDVNDRLSRAGVLWG